MKRVLAVLLALVACKSSLTTPPAAYKCDPDAGSAQCPDRMRCGLEGTCRPTDGGAYLCTNDSWCDDGWHCNFQGVCAAAFEDPLTAAPAASFLVARYSPQLTAAGITSFEVSPPHVIVLPGGEGAVLVTAVLGRDDGTFVQIDQTLIGFSGIQGALAAYDVGVLPWTNVTGPVTATPGVAWMLGSNGELHAAGVDESGHAFTFVPDGGVAPGATALISAEGYGFPLLVAHDGATLWPFVVVPTMGGPPTVVPVFGPMDPPVSPVPIEDVAIGALSYPAPEMQCAPVGPVIFVTGQDGSLHVLFPNASLSMLPTYAGSVTAWQTVALLNEDHSPLRAKRARLHDDILAVEGTPDSGHDVVMFQLRGCYSALAADVVQGFDICPVCSSDTLLDFWPEETVASGVAAYCQAADGTGYAAAKKIAVGPVGQPCGKLLSNPTVATSFFDEQKTVISRNAPGIAAFWGSHGNLWYGSSVSNLLPFLTPDLPGVAINGRVGNPSQPPPPDGGENFFLTYSGDGTYANSLFDGGLAIFAEGATTTLGMACEIVGPFRTLVLKTGTVSVHTGPPGDMAATSSSVVAQLADPNMPFNPPYNAVSFIADGGVGLAVTASGLILGADVTAAAKAYLATGTVPPTLMPAPFIQKAVLPPGQAIISLLSEPSGEVSFYALTSSALFHVTGALSERWNAAAIPIPPGDPKTLLDASGHVRIAYQDGRVFSLTTGLSLAPPLDDIGDFAQYCGATWALTKDGLYRLDVADGSVTGTWTRAYDVDALQLFGTGDPGLGKGRLRVSEDPAELQIMSGFGALVTVHAAGCATP